MLHHSLESAYEIIWDILAVRVDEKFLSEDGLPDMEKMQLIVFDPVHHGYVQLGDKVGQAFFCVWNDTQIIGKSFQV